MTAKHVRTSFLMFVTVVCVMTSFADRAVANGTSSPAPSTMMNMQGGSTPQSVENLANQPDTAPASPVSGIDWSIFNHHGAGFFIFLWGLTALIVGLQWPRRTWLRFAPPLALLGLVEFLILRNDPKVWPTGPIGFWISFQDPAVLQHRIFVLLILAIAVIELLRAGDLLPPLLRQFALPGLAVFGAVYLFFHKHGGLAAQHMMSDPSMAGSPAMQTMLATMKSIKREHLWFSLSGFGLAAAKLLADLGVLKGRVGASLWTVFAVVLGVYMLGYTE